MHWFVVDETNKNPRPGQFFIVGGLVFQGDQMSQTHDAVEAIRSKYGYRAGDQFKFDTNSRPDQVTVEDARSAKKDLVTALGQIGVRMITYLILHDIARAEERMEFGLNTVASAYNKLLTREQAEGCMMIDRDDSQYPHLVRLFQRGVSVKNRDYKLQNIKFYGMTSDNASHTSSAVDIALGGFRYCVNSASTDAAENKAVAESILQPLSRLLWAVAEGDTRRIGGYGYITRPEGPRWPPYATQYSSLTAKLASYSDASADGSAEEVA